MSWKQSQRRIQLRLIVKNNRLVFLGVGLWILISGVILLATEHTFLETLRILAFFQPAKSNFGFFYENMTEFIFFGFVVSVLFVDMRTQVRPEIALRVMAEEMENHAVIFHFSNLGRRTFELLSEHDVPIVVVDEDPERLEELIRAGVPCFVGSGRNPSDLKTANVAAARLVMVASDDLESSAILCSRVRQLNPRCQLVVRCFEDDMGQLLARRFQATVVSTSSVTTRFLQDYALAHRVQKAIVVGSNSLARRMIAGLQQSQVDVMVITEQPEEVLDLVEEDRFVEGRASDPAVLEMAEASEVQLLVISQEDLELALTTVDNVREVNRDCRILCRLYHDDAACVLTEEPYNCEILSTSRQALEVLKRQGALACLGIKSSVYATDTSGEKNMRSPIAVSKHPQRRKLG